MGRTINPNKLKKADIKGNIIENLQDDLWCVHEYLDVLKLPREDDQGQVYSIVGRIKQLEKRHLREMSDLESLYLSGERSGTKIKNNITEIPSKKNGKDRC